MAIVATRKFIVTDIPDDQADEIQEDITIEIELMGLDVEVETEYVEPDED